MILEWSKYRPVPSLKGLSLSTSCPGFLVSSNKDGSVKVWDVKNYLEPQLVFEKQTNLGHIICLEASCDSPFSFAIGGDNKSHNLTVIDFSSISEVSERFKDRELIKTITVNNSQNQENNVNEEVMDVAENFESIALESKKANKFLKKKKKPKL